MLGDEDRDADLRRQRLEQAGERVDAAGRSADRDQPQGGVGHIGTQAQRKAGRRQQGRSRTGREVGAAQRAQLAEQDFGEAPVEAPGAGLGQGVGGAKRERGDGFFGAVLGLRRDDQHLRAACGGEDPGDRFEAPGAGHFEVEQDDVDADFGERRDGVLGGARNGDDLEPAVALDHPAEHGARDDRIVDDHQPRATSPRGQSLRRHDPMVPRLDRRSRNRLQATPTSCSLMCSVSRSNGFMTYSSAPASSAARMCAMSFSVVQKTTLGWSS